MVFRIFALRVIGGLAKTIPTICAVLLFSTNAFAEHPYAASTHPLYNKALAAGMITEQPIRQDQAASSSYLPAVKEKPKLQRELELEILEAKFTIRKDDKKLKEDLLTAYRTRLDRLCPPGAKSLAERATPKTLDKCATLISKMLRIDSKNPYAICSRHGDSSEECLAIKSESDEANMDIYERINTYFKKQEKKTVSFTRGGQPLSRIPETEDIVEQIRQAAMNNAVSPTPQTKARLISLYEKMILAVCPSPYEAAESEKKGLTPPPKSSECLKYAGEIRAYDMENSLSQCYVFGYQSAGCLDYINLTTVLSQKGRLKGANRKPVKDDKGFVNF